MVFDRIGINENPLAAYLAEGKGVEGDVDEERGEDERLAGDQWTVTLCRICDCEAFDFDVKWKGNIDMFDPSIDSCAAQGAFDNYFYKALPPGGFDKEPKPRHGYDEDEKYLLQP